MQIRKLTAGDGPTARKLWDDLGGWYRNTSPAGDDDVDRAIARIVRRSTSSRLPRRGNPDDGGWVAVSGGNVVGWLYARSDPDQSYIVPLLPPEQSADALEGLVTSARTWFADRQIDKFVVDIPASRPDLRAMAQRGDQLLWHRAVLDRDLAPFPSASAVPATVREFRRSDLPTVQALFDARHPEKPPAPIPVAFLELRGRWGRDPAWELQRSIFLVGPRPELLGVAGGTHRPKAPIGFLGPWVLAQTASPPVVTELLEAVTGWLRGTGAQRVRTTTPSPPGDDARALLSCGFSSMAESDLFELRS